MRKVIFIIERKVMTSIVRSEYTVLKAVQKWYALDKEVDSASDKQSPLMKQTAISRQHHHTTTDISCLLLPVHAFNMAHLVGHIHHQTPQLLEDH
jgi:hypothetical protein